MIGEGLDTEHSEIGDGNVAPAAFWSALACRRGLERPGRGLGCDFSDAEPIHVPRTGANKPTSASTATAMAMTSGTNRPVVRHCAAEADVAAKPRREHQIDRCSRRD